VYDINETLKATRDGTGRRESEVAEVRWQEKQKPCERGDGKT
jgi:hypothetical protein